MSLPVRFVQTEYWNTSDSGSIGGTGVDTGVGTSLNDVFPVNVSSFIGQPSNFRFQKIVIENTGIVATDNISGAKVFFNNVKFPDQVALALSYGPAATDTGDHPTGYPTSYDSGDFSTPLGILNAISVTGLTGTIETGSSFGVWLRQEVQPDLPAETGAIATLGLIGEVG